MRATRIVPTLIAACLVASTSCGDAAAPTTPGGPAAAPPTPSTLTGVVHLSATKSTPVTLSLDTGEEVALDGPETAELVNLDNAVVDVRGFWNPESFQVSDFVVRQVDGAEVLDGVLVAMSILDMDGGAATYGLSLTRGPLVPLSNPPAELIAHVGARVWVAESPDGEPTAFGIIGR